MTQTLEVEIDEAGNIHPLDTTARPPAGRATLVWDSAGHELYLMSEKSLARDWLRPEEDEAWAYLQPDKS
jgi:hypothetical protein